MNFQTSLPYTGLFLIAGLALALALAYLVYYYKKNQREFFRGQRILLASIRGLAIFLIIFLVLALLLEISRRYFERPILVVAVDHSESMVADDQNIRSKVEPLVNKINAELSDQYEIQTIQFGDQNRPGLSFDFSEKASDYYQLFQKINDQYYNLNLGAVVVIGDGIVNKGNDPLFRVMNLKAKLFPVGTGDTSVVFDQAVSEVVHNPSVFLGNEFPVQVDLNFKDFRADSTRLEIMFGGKPVVKEIIPIIQPNFFLSKKYSIKADIPGLQSVMVRLVPLSQERNIQNNQYRFSIEVHEKKQKVLILGQGPHPDMGAFAESLQKQANLEVSTAYIQSFTGQPGDYDLVILNQLPSLAIQQSDLFEKIKTEKTAVLVVVGPSTSLSAFNNLGLHVAIEPSQSYEESLAFFNPGFSLFSIPSELKAMEDIFPPVLTFFTKYQMDSRFSVLAYQRINGINMDYPLMAFGEIDKQKIGVIFGEGIWRWRMREYQNFESNAVNSALIVNMVTYLTLKENQEQFTVRYKAIGDEITPVVLRAKLLDDIFEPVTGAEVSLVLKDSTGAELNYLFDPSDQDYELVLGYLPAGDYWFKAQTKLGEKDFVKEGQFSVQSIQLENQNLTANFALLKEMASLTGGQFFQISESDRLINLLNVQSTKEKKEHIETSLHEIIEWKWLFFILLALLSLEWFLRKFWGSY